MLHILIIYRTPVVPESQYAGKPPGTTVSFIGVMPEISAVFDKAPPRASAAERSHFYPPETEAVILEPPDITFAPGWEMPLPRIGGHEIPEIAAEDEEHFFEKEISEYPKESHPLKEEKVKF